MRDISFRPALLAAVICSSVFSMSTLAQTSPNLAVTGPGAGADGSGFSNTKTVRDNNTATYTQSNGTNNQRVSVKWSNAITFNQVILRESGNNITDWQLVNHDTGEVLSSGQGIGTGHTVNLNNVSMKKLSLYASGVPPLRMAEIEVYNSQATSSSSSSSSVASSSSSSHANSSASSSSSAGNPVGNIRPAQIEGFAAHAGVTGGNGGPVVTVSTGTELNAALCSRANMTDPIVIVVDGTINHGNTTAQGCNTQGDVIEIKKMSNVSIIGNGTNALFDEIGIHVREASNVIIQNVHIRNVKKSGSPTSNGGDAIGMESKVDRVWIDHNHLEASGGEKDGYDSLLDMKAGVTNVTVSYNLFNDSSRAGLIGSSDGDDKNTNITFHHNWYKNIEQRTPLIRHALVHMYNNYWSNDTIDYMFHAVNSRMHARALVESNYFYNVNNPIIASSDSSQPGCWQTNNDNTVLPEIYYSRSVGNGALVIPDVINGQLQSTCSVSVPYSVTLDAAADVPAIVTTNAGVGKI